MGAMSEQEIPSGASDPHESWPPQALIESFLGNFNFEFRPGEDTDIADSRAAQAAARRFRDVLGRYCSGVTVVASVSDGEPVGLTCQSFSSLSLDPPLVMFSPAKTSRAWPLIQRSGHFGVSFLATGQEDVSNVMASRGSDKFADVAWSLSSGGAPVIDGAVGFVDCSIHAVHEAGDHYIVVGRVHDMHYAEDGPAPLLFFKGAYRTVG